MKKQKHAQNHNYDYNNLCAGDGEIVNNLR